MTVENAAGVWKTVPVPRVILPVPVPVVPVGYPRVLLPRAGKGAEEDAAALTGAVKTVVVTVTVTVVD